MWKEHENKTQVKQNTNMEQNNKEKKLLHHIT
jgi:hypothetical protein